MEMGMAKKMMGQMGKGKPSPIWIGSVVTLGT